MANKMAALMDLMPLQGVLQQHTGTGMSKKWTKGFWQQKDMKLIMYNSETELDQPQSEIDLEQVTAVTRINDPKKGPQFQLTAPKKTYLFLASSIEEVYFWVDRLTSLVEKKNSKPAAPAAVTPSPAASTPTPTLAPAPPVSSPPVSPSIEISPAPRKGPPPRHNSNNSAATASPLSSSAPAPGPISPREPAPVPPSQLKGTKSAIFSHDRPPPPPRNVAGSSLNVRANMPTSSPASPSSPTSGTSINPRPPPPRGPSAFSLNKPAPSPPTPTKDLSNGSNDDPDGASKSGKPPPPKRLPPKPPGISLDESEATTDGPPSPPSSPTPGAVPRPPLPNIKSKPDQTKKRLPPTPGQKPSDAEHADGEGTNEEPHAPIDEEKRMPIIKEIVSTEQTYVNNLNIALKKYMTPLLESCGPKDKDAAKRKEEITSMFSNMEIIYGLNSELLKSLQECTECDPSSPKYLMVGDVFGRFTPFLKMYQQYSVGYEHAMEIFNKWTKDNTVCANLLKACNESTGTNLKLDHYLIFPIQRIPRYNLLLQDLIRHTPDGHPDKTKLQNALENNKKVAEHINSNLKQADNARKIVSAVAIDGLEQLMAPARYLIHHEKVEAARLDLAKYDFSRLTDIAKARAAPREKLQVFLFNNLFAVREDKVSLFGSSLTRANWVLPIQLWLKDDPGADTGLLFLGPHEGFYVNFPQAETRTAWIDSVAELSTGVDAYREFEYLSADERLYTGRWFAGKFDGVGTLYYYGNVYVGDWFSGLKQGNGKLTYSTGDVYDGQWENDMQNGEGTLTYAAGHTYIGEWRDGKRTGKGEMVFAEGKKYDGRWKDDLAFGVGVFTGCGVTYDGNWLNGKMHGKGTVEHPMYSYTGFFAKGKREGTGTCEWKDGSKYEGNWRDDKRTGNGKYTCESYVYDGEWANGKMEGKGKAEYGWGTYKGEWVQGTKSGKGSLSYNSGLNYEGTFKNDLFNGHGTVVYPNGYKWEGKFQNGLPEGKGTVSINMPNNTNQKKATFVASVKDREMTLALGKEDVKCPVIPDVPVFDLDL